MQNQSWPRVRSSPVKGGDQKLPVLRQSSFERLKRRSERTQRASAICNPAKYQGHVVDPLKAPSAVRRPPSETRTDSLQLKGRYQNQPKAEQVPKHLVSIFINALKGSEILSFPRWPAGQSFARVPALDVSANWDSRLGHRFMATERQRKSQPKAEQVPNILCQNALRGSEILRFPWWSTGQSFAGVPA